MYDFDFTGFSPYVFARGKMSLSVTTNGLTLNNKATEHMKNHKYMSILTNENKKQIVILPSDEKTDTSYKFPNADKVRCARINPAGLVEYLCELANVDKSKGFRVCGEAVDGFILFDLSKAKELNRKARR